MESILPGASEGLNLQAAAALINYDLPWNPSRIEQRIGRIDRIGQTAAEVRIVNLFLKDSIDDRVYRVLRDRCGLFQHFVGPMQPVLARARRMLLGQEHADPRTLVSLADQSSDDELAAETYLQSDASGIEAVGASLGIEEIEAALRRLDGNFGLEARDEGADIWSLWRHGAEPVSFGASVTALERDRSLRPLSPFDKSLKTLVGSLWQAGERLPLVIDSHEQGTFRRSIALWLDGSRCQPVETFAALVKHLDTWNGTAPTPEAWVAALEEARTRAMSEVREMEKQADERQTLGLRRQLDAARLRLQRELGRYLIVLDPAAADLDQVFYRQMQRDTPIAVRLRECYRRLAGYPVWDADLLSELKRFERGLSEHRRTSRLAGNEILAALADPRWSAQREYGHAPSATMETG
jgi:hypothetical protein